MNPSPFAMMSDLTRTLSSQMNESTIQQLPQESFWPAWGFAFIFLCFEVYATRKALLAYNAIESTPTSKIRSAAQGYVELVGTQYNHDHHISPLSLAPCTWYNYKIYYKENKNTTRCIEEQSSTTPYLLRDETGECLIIPPLAHVETNLKQSWRGFSRFPKHGYPQSWWVRFFGYFGPYTYVEERMENNSYGYALGEFKTIKLDQLLSPEQTKQIFSAWGNAYNNLSQLSKNTSITWGDVLRHCIKKPLNTSSINLITTLGLSAQQPFVLSCITQEAQRRKFKIRAYLSTFVCILLSIGLLYFLMLRF